MKDMIENVVVFASNFLDFPELLIDLPSVEKIASRHVDRRTGTGKRRFCKDGNTNPIIDKMMKILNTAFVEGIQCSALVPPSSRFHFSLSGFVDRSRDCKDAGAVHSPMDRQTVSEAIGGEREGNRTWNRFGLLLLKLGYRFR